jgi:hypothetical protein
MWLVMWSRLTVLVLQLAHEHERQRLLVDLRPMCLSHKWSCSNSQHRVGLRGRYVEILRFLKAV